VCSELSFDQAITYFSGIYSGAIGNILLRIKVVTYSRVRNRFITDGIREYLKRARPYARIELEDRSRKNRGKFSGTGMSYDVALDSGGEQVSSYELARILTDHEEISFHIGSPDGLPEAVRDECDMVLSLSKMTFTGELSQLLLMEQIYRAITIINSHPYHR
jgi:23S rRNA (pseudouridine1915-N3)-methyltransferase